MTFNEQIRFIRIQSTACEQHRWVDILTDLDNDFLMNLAIGTTCIIYDFSKRGITRAIWQGLEFIKYVLNRIWFGSEINPIMRNGHNAKTYFNAVYHSLPNKILNRIKYYRKFLLTDELNLYSVTSKTVNDGDYEFYVNIMHSHKKRRDYETR